MSKPTEKTDWAISPEALVLATGSSRWNLGWQTLPDNLTTDVGEKPNLQHQNYWQNAVHTWLTYFDVVVPDEAGPGASTDMWEWDTGRVRDQNDDPYCTELQSDGADSLQWQYSTGIATQYPDLLPDNLVGARYQETLYYLTLGLSFQLFDGSGVKWTISYSGTGSVSDALSMTGSSRLVGENIFLIDGSDPTIAIEKDDGGIITNPASFSTFTAILNTASFDSNNPTGIRVVANGTSVLGSFIDTPGGFILQGIPAKKVWIRPIDNTSNQATGKTIDDGEISFAMAFDVYKTYKVSVNINSAGDLTTTPWQTYSRFIAASTFQISHYMPSNTDRSIRDNFAFTTKADLTDSGITIDYTPTELARESAVENDYDAIYGVGNFYTNWIRVEEDV